MKENDYILATRALGAGAGRIMTRHILLNIAAPIIALLAALLSYAILAGAALSYPVLVRRRPRRPGAPICPIRRATISRTRPGWRFFPEQQSASRCSG